MGAHRPHILLIDDDLEMHAVVRLILESLDFRVSCCTNTETGLHLLRTDPPDLLLLDIMLSTPTEGLEFASRLRADGNLAKLPIIMVSSAAADLASHAGGTEVAADLFLEKPLEARELRAAVAQFVQGNGEAAHG